MASPENPYGGMSSEDDYGYSELPADDEFGGSCELPDDSDEIGASCEPPEILIADLEKKLGKGGIGVGYELLSDEQQYEWEEIFEGLGGKSNKDGKLSKAELEAYLSLQAKKSKFKGVRRGSYGKEPKNNLNASILLYIPVNSYLHEVPLEKYPQVAWYFRERQLHEYESLRSMIAISRECFHTYLESFSGITFLVSGPSRVAAEVREWVLSQNVPTPELREFDKLIKRLDKAFVPINSSEFNYADLYKTGLKFHQIRFDLAALDTKVTNYRNSIIDGAGDIVGGAELVESVAFGTLHAGAAIYAAGDPLREAAMKIGIMISQALSRSLGEGIAIATQSSSTETVIHRNELERRLYQEKQLKRHLRSIWLQAWRVIRKDLPGILIGLAMGFLTKGRVDGLVDSGKSKTQALEELDNRWEKAAMAVIELHLDLTWKVIDAILFSEKGVFDAKVQEKLAFDCAEAIVKKILEVVFNVKSDSKLMQDLVRDYVPPIGTAILKTIAADYRAVCKQAKKNNEPESDVLMSQLPVIIVHICVAIMEELVKTFFSRAAKNLPKNEAALKKRQLEQELDRDMKAALDAAEKEHARKARYEPKIVEIVQPKPQGKPRPDNATAPLPKASEVRTLHRAKKKRPQTESRAEHHGKLERLRDAKAEKQKAMNAYRRMARNKDLQAQASNRGAINRRSHKKKGRR